MFLLLVPRIPLGDEAQPRPSGGESGAGPKDRAPAPEVDKRCILQVGLKT